jgi:hypothetical protein
MEPLTRADLLSLEEYEAQRPQLRAEMREHKAARRLDLDSHISVYFEDRDTMRYQIQEMMRAERLFKPEELDEELAVYNPLIPDGRNLKATFMIQYDDRAERDRQLTRLAGIERVIWLRVDGLEPVWAYYDEDLERGTEDKTSTVHFLRFELSEPAVAAWREGAEVVLGVDHAERRLQAALPADLQQRLAADFD